MSTAPFGLTTADIPAPWSARFFDALGSTSDEALAAVRAGEITAPTLFLTSRQTAGRGRGRGAGSWSTTDGNLAVSFVHFPTAPAQDWPVMSYAAGLMIAAALEEVCGFADRSVGLKWPNDVFVAGGKVAGLLLETMRAPDGRQALVLGLGLNLVSAPEIDRADYVARSLVELGYDAPPRALVRRLIVGWSETTARFDEQSGHRGQLFADWQAKALYLNEEISVRIDTDQRVSGRFIGLDDQSGALKLQRPSGAVQLIMAGDVGLAATPNPSAPPERA